MCYWGKCILVSPLFLFIPCSILYGVGALARETEMFSQEARKFVRGNIDQAEPLVN